MTEKRREKAYIAPPHPIGRMERIRKKSIAAIPNYTPGLPLPSPPTGAEVLIKLVE